jgi:hypothetical protein
MLFVGNWLFRKDIQDIIIQSRMVSKWGGNCQKIMSLETAESLLGYP